jgi:hypothetical protein
MESTMQEGLNVKQASLGFNWLAIIAGLLMVIAMFFPWWSFSLQFAGQTDLYPYLISGPGSELIGYKRSPQMTLLTGVIIGAIVFCLVGSVLKGKLGRGLLVTSGVLILLAAWRLLIRVAGVAARFNIPLQGEGVANYEGFAIIEVSTWLRPGLYLVVAGAILAIAAAIFHNRLRVRVEG